jgi:hypothetical protein
MPSENNHDLIKIEEQPEADHEAKRIPESGEVAPEAQQVVKELEFKQENNGLDEDSEGTSKSVKTNGSISGGAATRADTMATRNSASPGKEEAYKTGDQSQHLETSPKAKAISPATSGPQTPAISNSPPTKATPQLRWSRVTSTECRNPPSADQGDAGQRGLPLRASRKPAKFQNDIHVNEEFSDNDSSDNERVKHLARALKRGTKHQSGKPKHKKNKKPLTQVTQKPPAGGDAPDRVPSDDPAGTEPKRPSTPLTPMSLSGGDSSRK